MEEEGEYDVAGAWLWNIRRTFINVSPEEVFVLRLKRMSSVRVTIWDANTPKSVKQAGLGKKPVARSLEMCKHGGILGKFGINPRKSDIVTVCLPLGMVERANGMSERFIDAIGSAETTMWR